MLNDTELGDTVPWYLGEIGESRAIGPLIAALERDDPSGRVTVIYALETLNAREALPYLQELLRDNRRSNSGDRPTVAQAASRAVATISHQR